MYFINYLIIKESVNWARKNEDKKENKKRINHEKMKTKRKNKKISEYKVKKEETLDEEITKRGKKKRKANKKGKKVLNNGFDEFGGKKMKNWKRFWEKFIFPHFILKKFRLHAKSPGSGGKKYFKRR